MREQRVGDNSFRRWEKLVDQSETTLFPPITAFRSSQQRNFPDNHEGPSTIQRLPTGSPPHHRHFPPSVAAWSLVLLDDLNPEETASRATDLQHPISDFRLLHCSSTELPRVNAREGYDPPASGVVRLPSYASWSRQLVGARRAPPLLISLRDPPRCSRFSSASSKAMSTGWCNQMNGAIPTARSFWSSSVLVSRTGCRSRSSTLPAARASRPHRPRQCPRGGATK